MRDAKAVAKKEDYHRYYMLFVKGRGKKWYVGGTDSYLPVLRAEIDYLFKNDYWQIWECHGPHAATLIDKGRVKE